MVSLSYLLGRSNEEKVRSEKKAKRSLERRATDIYVSPSGSDSNAGTLSAPKKTIQAAVDLAKAGDTIYLRAGTYTPTVSIKFKTSGTSSARITLTNYQSEKVIVDGEGMPYTPAELDGSIPDADRGIFHINANYWTFRGIELVHGPYGIYSRDASNNIYENLITHDNYETGVQIQGAASNNQVINLDSYNNRDPRKNGESADGLAIKEGEGTGNIVRGARLWNNVDDGLDFWEFRSAITVENSYSWGNGFNRWGFTEFEGDGNGFKLGGGDAADIGDSPHVIKNSIAFLNAAGGFVYNSQPGAMTLTGNTAFNNLGTGFIFKKSGPTLKNNIAASNKVVSDIVSSVTTSGNSWNVGGTWNNASFMSVDSSKLTGARWANGSVVGSNFLRPTSGSTIGATTWL